jgi:predicted TIM-barrel fold metal-dependent hydrolase
MKTKFELPSELAVGLVDAHAHITQRTSDLIAQRHSQPEVDVSATDYVDLLRDRGLSYGVLTAPSFYGMDNTILLQALQEYPKVLRGVVNAEPDTSVDKLRKWDEQGVVGVRFNLIRKEFVPDFSTKSYQAFFKRLIVLGWHVEIYIESSRFAQIVAPILESGVDLVIDHFGYPVEPEGINAVGFRAVLAALRRPNVYVKLSAPYRLPLPSLLPVVEALKDAGGVQSMVWGSDWPWVSFREGQRYDRCMAWLVDWLPDPQERFMVASENPRRIFRFT